MKLPRWFHQLGSPPYVYRLADRLCPWLGGLGVALLVIGAYWGLVIAPPDFQQGEAYAEAFFAGYYSERPLSSSEHAAISPFLTIRRIWLTSIFSQEDGLVGHTFIAPA